MVTIKALRALKPNLWLTDGGARGAGALVFRRTGGVIRAYFRHTQADGTRYALPLGHYDEEGRNGISLGEARSKAAELSKLYVSGVKNLRGHLEAEEAAHQAAQDARRAAEDAALAETQARKQLTLIALCQAYADTLERRGKNKSAGTARSVFKVHVFDKHKALSEKPAKDITAHEIATIVRKVRDTGKERTAGVLRSYLRAAYAMAIRAPFDSSVPADLIAFGVELNPIDAIPAIPVKARHRTLSCDELHTYLTSLTDALPDQALRLALYAGGQRMSQLLRARVADYDAETQVLRLWDGKGKRREPREHLLPLGPTAANLVAKLIQRAKAKAKLYAEGRERATEPNPSLWLSTAGTTMSDATPGKRLADIAAALQVEAFDLRDIRRTAETMLAGMAISRETRAQLLSHGLSGVQSVHYDRYSYTEEKRAALVAWEERLMAIEKGSTADQHKQQEARAVAAMST